MADCIHCNTPLEVSQEASGFCCTGCEFVHGLIHDEGLEKFYDLKREQHLSPLNDKPFQEQDFSWLVGESSNGISQWDGAVEGVSCIGCVWLIERVFLKHDGASRCDISPAEGKIHLEWRDDGGFSPSQFAEELLRFGYLLGPPNKQHAGRSTTRQLASKTAICAAFAMNAMGFSLPRYLGMPSDFMFADIFEMIVMLSATLSLLVGGSWFIQRSIQSLRAGVLHMDTPIALGVSLAFIGSVIGWATGHFDLVYFDFVAVFIFLMLGGRWIQTAALERNRNKLIAQTPVPDSILLEDESIRNLDEIEQHTRYLLPRNKTLPVTSRVVSGTADFSLEWINGEADPCCYSAGMTVPAGSILLSNDHVVFEALETWSESLLAKLLTQEREVSSAGWFQKILRIYLSTVIVIGLSGGALWLLIDGNLAQAAQVMISIFVISCPCALGVAVPIADELASSQAQASGVFVRRPTFWARLRGVRTLIFDKTGTLTRSLPDVVNVHELSKLDDRTTAMLATLCAGSLHPFSRALLGALSLRGQKLIQPHLETEEHPGLGVSLVSDDGVVWSLGKCGWHDDSPSLSNQQAGSELRCDGKLVAHFTFEEAIRPQARESIHNLPSFDTHILSGDHDSKVAAIAQQLDLPASKIHARLSPENKADLVMRIDPTHALFLGDGANDALAFDAASVTGAVAGRGLLESKADFFFLSNGLGFLPRIIDISKRHGVALTAVFSFSVLYNLAAIAVCLAGLMNPLLAAILMPISSLISLAIVRFLLVGNRCSTPSIANTE